MKSQDESGKDQSLQTSQTTPTIIVAKQIPANPNESTISVFMKHHRKKIIIGSVIALLVVCIPIVGTLTEIPNNVMNWFTNWRQVNSKSGGAVNNSQRLLTERAMSSISADFRAGYHVDFEAMMLSNSSPQMAGIAHRVKDTENVQIRITSMADGPVRLGKQIISVFTNGGFRVRIISDALPDPENEGVAINYPLDYDSNLEFKKALNRLFKELGQRPNIIVGTNAVGQWMGTDARVIFIKVGNCPP